MTDYINTTCPVCKEKFTEELRPLICPDCGAPYHRACWDKNGRCVFSASHGGGFVWSEKPGQGEPKQAATEPKPDDQAMRDGLMGDIREALDKMGFFEQADMSFGEERFIFGVSEREIAHFQGVMNPMRFLKYRRIAEGHKISLNVFAGLLIPYYIFYSRMRAAGIVAALVAFLLGLPGTLIVFFAVSGLASPFTAEQLSAASSSLFYIYFAFRIALALFFDYFYLLWMSGRIKRIRSHFALQLSADPSLKLDLEQPLEISDLGEDYYKYLQDAGKPSLLYTLLDSLAINVALMFLLYFILYTVLG